jgi:pilus assembly protein CpaC
VKEISGNLLTRDRDGGLGNGFLGHVFRGRTVGTIEDVLAPTAAFPGSPVPRPYNPATGQPIGSTILGTGYQFNNSPGLNSLGAAGKLFGIDVMAALDLGERSGLVATLAQPNLTAISGETADFLAGGEFPIPIPGNFSGTTIEYRKYGVSLAYTPTVLSNGRISLRVRPEVSELSSEGAIRLQGFEIPALTIRRAETTVELGSGESFMIAGLMNNRTVSAIDKVPGVGDVPILGMLFKSDNFRRGETELVIVVTPYLVKPVSANEIALPTDAFQNSGDLGRILLGQTSNGVSGGERPKPKLDTNLSDADRRRLMDDDNVSPGFSVKK